MGNTPKLVELEMMTDNELRQRIAADGDPTSSTGLNFYFEELRRRQSVRLMRTMEYLTWALVATTLAVMAHTVVLVAQSWG